MNKALIDGQVVYFGSSERMDDVKDGSVSFFMTSPPYWNLKDYGHPDQIGASSYEEYLERLGKVWQQCFQKASDDAVLIVNVNSRRHQGEFFPIAFDIARTITGWKLWDVVVWYIPNALPQPKHYIERLFDNKFEYVLVFIKGDSKGYKFHKPRVPQKYRVADPRAHKKNPKGRCLGNVVRIPAYRPPNVKKLGYHVAAYPEELVALMLESYTDPGDTVLDPFLGSGTTLKVARVMGRKGIGFELNEDFRPLIEARIREPWAVPDWSSIDVINSTTADPGMTNGPRKIQFHKNGSSEEDVLFPLPTLGASTKASPHRNGSDYTIDPARAAEILGVARPTLDRRLKAGVSADVPGAPVDTSKGGIRSRWRWASEDDVRRWWAAVR